MAMHGSELQKHVWDLVSKHEGAECAESVFKYISSNHAQLSQEYNRFGILFHYSQDLHRAEISFMFSLLCQPTSETVYQRLVSVQVEAKRYYAAESAIQGWLKLNQRSHKAYYFQGMTLEGLRKYEEAKNSFATALQIMPQFAQAKWRLNKIDEKVQNLKQLDNFTFDELKNNFLTLQKKTYEIQFQNSQLVRRIEKYEIQRKAKFARNICVVCLDAPACCINKRCGHISLCQACLNPRLKCPICRARGKYIKIFIP